MPASLNWRGEWPPEVRAAVEPHLHRWLGVVPRWCHEIIVRWNPDCTDSSMRCDVRPQYRDTVLEVCPAWLDMEEASRENAVVHELAHILVGPLMNFARETIRDVSDDGTALRAVLDRQCTNAFEGVVEDAARAFVRQGAKLGAV